MGTEISIIIACRNEAKDLPKCLRGIELQSISKERFETIFVDGGSHDGTVEIINNFRRHIPNLGLLHESGKFKSAANARNQGAAAADGKIIVFFDADVIVDKNYLKEILKGFEKRTDAASTAVRSFPSLSIWAELRKHETLASDYLVERGKGEFFPNIFRKVIFEKIKGYDARFRYGEDLNILDKLKKANAKVTHIPAAVAFHKDPDSFAEIAAQSRFWGGGFFRLFWNNPAKHFPRLALVTARALLLPLALIYLAMPYWGLFWIVAVFLIATLFDGLMVLYRSLKMGGKMKYAAVLMPFRMIRSYFFLQGFALSAWRR